MTNFLNHPELKVTDIAVFDERSSYVNLSRLYFSVHQKIPSIKVIGRINMDSFKKWIEEQKEFALVCDFTKERFEWKARKMRMVNSIYLLENGIMIDIEEDHVVGVAFTTDQKEDAQKIIDEAKRYRIKVKKSNSIRLIVSGTEGLETERITLSKPKLSVPEYYNDDLTEHHNSILKCLNKKAKSGIMLFYGDPGTGKSTYIRYLIHYIKKDVIFMSPAMASNLDSPSLTRLLINNPNSVLIIEDAEDLLISREKGKNSSISMLLNLTDGLLGDSLGIQIIATFNTHVSNIDKALLRKGRLNTLYEFKPLSVEKSKRLLEKNGTTNYIVNKPMTLAELFNISEDAFQYHSERQSIGFFNKAV